MKLSLPVSVTLSAVLSLSISLPGVAGEVSTVVHSQTDQRYIKSFENKELISWIKQGFENENSNNPSQLKNDLGISFTNVLFFDGKKSLKIKLTEDDGNLIDERVITRDQVFAENEPNKYTGELQTGIKLLYIELPKGKRILKGLTFEFPELGYSQHFDRVYEATPQLFRAKT
jgi:hypothetical protein